MAPTSKQLRNAALAAGLYGVLFRAHAPRTPGRLLYLTLAAWIVELTGRAPPPRWHTGARWKAFLDLYHVMAARKLPGFLPVTCPTSFGNTHIWQNKSNDSTAPVVVFFHAARSTSLCFSDLATEPSLCKSHRLVLIDYIADAGLSVPYSLGGPKTAAEHAQWAREVLAALGITSADLVGFSYGSFVAAMVAMEWPDLVRSSKVILNSPAAVFSSVKPGYLFRVLFPHLLPARVAAALGLNHDWTWNSLTSPNFDYPTACPRDIHDFYETSEKINFEFQLPQMPERFDDAALARLASSAARVVLIIGDKETVVDPVEAVARARRAGVEVTIIEDAGHINVHEKPDVFVKLNAELLLADSMGKS